MCFGKDKKDTGEEEPAPRPAQANNVKNRTSMGAGPSGQQAFAPQPSAPPQPQYSTSQPQYAPPQPQYSSPPPGPGPEPGASEAPPSYDSVNPQHDWQAAVPDTSLFPPPPAIFSGFDRSPSCNATEEEAIAGEAWCEQYPMSSPMVLDDAAKGALHFNNIRLMEPTGFNGTLTWIGPGHWKAQTAANSPDRCLISYPPLYVVNEHDPVRTGRPSTIYYEVALLPESPTNFVAMGFTALPYPSFRLPGWHRGSLAVHGDDGHKYINDRWGGKTFTAQFRQGDTYGIGMTVKPTGGDKPLVDVFFTRNGELAGGWNVHEETDAEQDLPVMGLEGFHDLCAAIGLCDNVRFEVIFEPSRWLYQDLN